MARSRTLPIPPIRVGTQAVTFTNAAGELVFKCRLLALRRDGVDLKEIDHATRDNVVADLQLPDGTEVRDIPYNTGLRGPTWTRPFIQSATYRY